MRALMTASFSARGVKVFPLIEDLVHNFFFSPDKTAQRVVFLSRSALSPSLFFLLERLVGGLPVATAKARVFPLENSVAPSTLPFVLLKICSGAPSP